MEWLIMILVVIALVILIARFRRGVPSRRSERIRLRYRQDSTSTSGSTDMVHPAAYDSGLSRAGRFGDGRSHSDSGGGDSGGSDGGGG